MQAAIAQDDKTVLDAILRRLTQKNGELGTYLITGSRDEYDRLLQAALAGRTPAAVTLGRNGLKMDRKLIIPPDSILCC